MAGVELRFRFLGSFGVRANARWYDGPAPKRGRELLQYLGAYPRRLATVEALATAFWPDVDGEAVAHRIHLSVSGARSYLRSVVSEPKLIRRSPGGYAWDPQVVVTSDVDDLLRFARSDSMEALESALAIYAGDFLPGETADWLQPLRMRCASAYEGAAEALAIRAFREGEYGRALSYGLELIDADPAHEAATRLAMRCFALLGQRGRALECYDGLRAYLRRMLGLQPGAETNELARSLRDDEHVEIHESEARAAFV
jgi:DNA-binding SARP family transcriptional activator